VKVHWTNTAVDHLLAIYEFIACDSPMYAQRMVDRLTSRSRQIAAFPLAGAVVPEYQAPDVREILEKPYRIIYRVTTDCVHVLAVVHAAKLLPPEPD